MKGLITWHRAVTLIFFILIFDLISQCSSYFPESSRSFSFCASMALQRVLWSLAAAIPTSFLFPSPPKSTTQDFATSLRPIVPVPPGCCRWAKARATSCVNETTLSVQRTAWLATPLWSAWGTLQLHVSCVSPCLQNSNGARAPLDDLVIDTGKSCSFLVLLSIVELCAIGSSNTWVGANKPYKRTRTSQDTGLQVHVGYGRSVVIALSV
jgi:hypothetical protein